MFRADATVQARVTGVEINQTSTASVSRLFAEDAWQYSEVSLRIVAQLLGEEPAGSLALISRNQFVQIEAPHANQRFSFGRDETLGLRLLRVEKLEGGVPAEIVEFQSYRVSGDSLSIPEERLNFRRLEYVDVSTRKVRADDSPSLQGETTLLAWKSGLELTDSVFELPTNTAAGFASARPGLAQSPSDDPREGVGQAALGAAPKLDLRLSVLSRYAWVALLAGVVAIAVALRLRFRRV